VHRHTVRARIAAAERALDVDLGTFAARAELWAALSLSEASAP
jgi:purine catabolism regulator